MIIIAPSRLTEGAFRKHTEGGAGSGISDRRVAAAVERREGARAYVTGARGHPRKVFRCSLVSSSGSAEEAGEHQGAAFRTSALAALRSLTGEDA